MTSSTSPHTAVRAESLLRHYAEVRARLMNFPVKVKEKPPVKMLVAIQEEPMAPLPVVLDTVPLNMLTTPSWRFLVALAAVRHGVSSEDILGPRRVRTLIVARCDAMGLMYQHTPASLPRIGLCLNRDHTTVLHALRKIGKTFKLVDLPAGHKTGRPPKQELSPQRIKSKTAWEAHL